MQLELDTLERMLNASAYAPLLKLSRGRPTSCTWDREMIDYVRTIPSAHCEYYHIVHRVPPKKWKLCTYGPGGEAVLTLRGKDYGTAHHAIEVAERILEMGLRKPTEGVHTQGKPNGVKECDLALRWPTLWEHITQQIWDDGTQRLTSTVTLSSDGSRVVACLRDRAMGAVGFHSAMSFAELLDSLEMLLASETMDMRADRFATKKK